MVAIETWKQRCGNVRVKRHGTVCSATFSKRSQTVARVATLTLRSENVRRWLPTSTLTLRHENVTETFGARLES